MPVQDIPRITAVTAMGSSRLRVRFDNGVEKIYECAPLLARPEFRLLNEPAFFRAVRVDAGGYGVSWNDAMDLSEHELWTNGKLVDHESAAQRAPLRPGTPTAPPSRPRPPRPGTSTRGRQRPRRS